MFRAASCLIALALLAGCVTAFHLPTAAHMEQLPFSDTRFDGRLAWSIGSAGDRTVIEGLFRNIRYPLMTELELWAWPAGREHESGRASYFVPDLREGEIAAFRLELPRQPSGSRVQLLYKYLETDGGGESGSAARWSQTFEIPVP